MLPKHSTTGMVQLASLCCLHLLPCPTVGFPTVGVYGTTGGSSSSTALCSGNCSAGYVGNTTGNTAQQCNGVCPAGYFCPNGSTNATANPCPLGQYGSTSGASACTPCPMGTILSMLMCVRPILLAS